MEIIWSCCRTETAIFFTGTVACRGRTVWLRIRWLPVKNALRQHSFFGHSYKQVLVSPKDPCYSSKMTLFKAYTSWDFVQGKFPKAEFRFKNFWWFSKLENLKDKIFKLRFRPFQVWFSSTKSLLEFFSRLQPDSQELWVIIAELWL